MPGGRTKFQEAWLSKELDGIQVKEWCMKAETNFAARCMLCAETFDTSNSGFSQVKSHHKGKKHRLKFDGKFFSKPIFEAFRPCSEGTGTARGTGELPFDLQVLKAEAVWALKIAQNNISFKSCNEVVELFKEMFPDSKIAAGMELKEKKVAYVISHGLAKHFEDEVRRDLLQSASKMTIAFDETTNVQVKRQLDIYVRYWSSEINAVSCRYLTSIFMGHATADLLLKELLDTFSSFDILLKNILCLSMDGPNVNRSLLRKFNEGIQRETGKECLDLGICNLHVTSNAFKQLLSSLLFDFDEFATDIHYFLKNSAARRQDYKAVEEITSVTVRFLMHHVSNRWLTAGPVAERLLEQWPNLVEYFSKFLPQQKPLEKQLANSERYKRIREALNVATPCYLAFICFAHRNFEKFSLCFQSELPKIHLLYSEVNSLIRNVMGLFILDNIVVDKHGHDLQAVDLESESNWKPLRELEIGMKAKNLVVKLEEKVRKRFLLDVRSALITTTKYLKKNLPFCNQKLKDMEILKPRISCEVQKQTSVTEGLHEITRICNYVHFSEEMTDKVREEWKEFQCDKFAHEELNKCLNNDAACAVRADHYWRRIFCLTDQFGREKYTNLAHLIKASLILPHGNADPERGFSINNAMLSKDRLSFNDMTIRSLRVVKGAVQHYGGVCKVPITGALLHSVKNSHKLYREYLEKQREEEKKLQKEKEQKEKESKEKEAEKKRKAQLDVKIRENDDAIQKMKKERQTALAVIQEGNERMKKAVSVLSTTEIKIAQNLIIQGTEELSKLDAQLSALEEEKEKYVKKRLKS